MFIPINTDAPLYHRPFATFGLIFANIGAFISTGAGIDHEGWLLTFGNGLHPEEWIYSAFLHFGFLHLLGNMFFLFAYGLIIEGKIGTLKFLGLYFFITFLDGCLTQTLMLASDRTGGAGGASGVIFGLIAIALCWAPENEFEVVWVYFPFGMLARAGTGHVSVLFLSGFYLVINLLQALIVSFEMSTPVLHLLGAVIGLPIGLLFLKRKWVDCEGWDIISVWTGKTQSPGLRVSQWKSSDDSLQNDQPTPLARERMTNADPRGIDRLVASKKYTQAVSLYLGNRDDDKERPMVSEKSLRKLIRWMQEQQEWKNVAVLLEDFLQRSTANENRVRLMLAQIYVTKLSRPKAAMKTLASVEVESLDQKNQRLHALLRDEAKHQVRQGILEISN